MTFDKTVLLVPLNDPEAVMIYRLAQAMKLPTLVSAQPHGASLDAEPRLLARVKKGLWRRLVIVEMPGLKTEARLLQAGIELIIIDHHHYIGLDRAHHQKTHKLLPSSLEQFLKLFLLTDARLRSFGFDPRLVRAIGIMDRGFVWALRQEGYGENEVRQVLEFQQALLQSVGLAKDEPRKMAIARRIWTRRKRWDGYTLVVADSAIELRRRLSFIIALSSKKSVPLILVERRRKLIYVQESPHAMKLFAHFGGFTFGMDRNWGYKNEKGQPRVTLRDVQRFLEDSKPISSLGGRLGRSDPQRLLRRSRGVRSSQ